MGRTNPILLAISLAQFIGPAFAQPARQPTNPNRIVVAAVPTEMPTPHEPAQPRDESDYDRVHAAALFTEGRLFFQREQFGRALQKYQRAYRYSHAKRLIVEEIVPLAYRIGRHDEAFRYIDVADETVDIDPFVLRRLAILFTEQGQFGKASQLYERIVRTSAAMQQSNVSDGSADGTQIVTHFELGRLYFLMERYDDAAKYFDSVASAIESAKKKGVADDTIKAILERPEVTYGVFAETFLNAKLPQKAKHYFQLSAKHSGDDTTLHFELARVANASGELAAAERHLDDYFQSNGTKAGAQPYFLLQEIYSTRHKEQADRRFIDRLKELSSKDQHDISVGYVLAEQLTATGQLDEATELYRKLIEREPLLEAFLGFCHIALKQNDAESFLSATSQVATVTGEFTAVDPILEMAARNREFVREVLQFAKVESESESDSGKTLGYSLIGAKVAMHAKLFSESDELFQRAADASEPVRADIYSMWTMSMLNNDRLDAAAVTLQKAIDLVVAPDRNAEWYFYLAGVHAAKGQTDLAMQAASKCAELGSGSPHFEFREPWIMYLCDAPEEARLSYQRFLKNWSGKYHSPEIRAVVKDAYLTLSTISSQLGLNDEAIESLEQVLDEFPGDIGTMNDLAYVWADQGTNLRRALVMAKTAVASQPENAAYRDSLGWVLYRLGRHSEAVTELRSAVALDSDDPVLLDHLADALLASNMKGDARDIWKRASDLASSSELRSDIESKLKQIAE